MEYQPRFNIWIEDVKDYTVKIRKLDPSFTPTIEESQKRFEKYLKHLEHIRMLAEDARGE